MKAWLLTCWIRFCLWLGRSALYAEQKCIDDAERQLNDARRFEDVGRSWNAHARQLLDQVNAELEGRS